MTIEKNVQIFKTPEETGIAVREANSSDLEGIQTFLERPDIDSLFVPPLSDSTRGITIKDRVEKKFTNGRWFIAVMGKKIVGCMAVIPAKFTKETQLQTQQGYINEGVSTVEWNKDEIWELSTVVTDQRLSKKEGIKGIGGILFEKAKKWVRSKGKQVGLITDSWVGGVMGEFVMTMNTKEYQLHHKEPGVKIPDTLLRIYSDPEKRGVEGPPTVIYGIPLDNTDWYFFESKQTEIESLRKEYEHIKTDRL